MAEDDFEGWKEMNSRLGDKIMLVGDDLFVTNNRLEVLDMGPAYQYVVSWDDEKVIELKARLGELNK